MLSEVEQDSSNKEGRASWSRVEQGRASSNKSKHDIILISDMILQIQ